MNTLYAISSIENQTPDLDAVTQPAAANDPVIPEPTIVALWDQAVELMRSEKRIDDFGAWFERSIENVVRQSVNDVDSELADAYEYTLTGIVLCWEDLLENFFEQFVAKHRNEILHSFRIHAVDSLSEKLR